MNRALIIAQVVSIIAFLAFGIACLTSPRFIKEFERYRLPNFRRLTGVLEIAGALGLSVGFFYEPLRTLSAACLALLMVCGIIARARIKDTFLDMLPALILLIVNLFICLGPR
jgi:intracellular septation protein A